MNAKVCDRCGAFYKYTIDRIQMSGMVLFCEDNGKLQSLDGKTCRDLCPCCFASLTRWFNMVDERGNREKTS